MKRAAKKRRADRSQYKPDLSALQRRVTAMVQAADAAPLTLRTARDIVSFDENAPPVAVNWDHLFLECLFSGIVIDADTITSVESLLSSGKVPGVFWLGDWVFVDAVRLTPLAQGGAA